MMILSKQSNKITFGILSLLSILFFPCSIHPVFGREAENISNENYNQESTDYWMSKVTCQFYEQPMNHFDPQNELLFYQRYCTYSKSGTATAFFDSTRPILFYTGNESPLEEYIPNTGFMWELSDEFDLIFVEHRMEGKSFFKGHHKDDDKGCGRYLSIHQALHDYARIISNVINPNHSRPIITVGGSYGGMLSAYMRFRYPSLVAGAISASGPIWGLQLTTKSEDASAIVISNAIRRTNDVCANNMQYAWPLLTYYGEQRNNHNLNILSKLFQTCQPIQSIRQFVSQIQSVFFNLAEANYPFASSYIPFALNMGKYKLPPWPLQHACQPILRKNYNIQVHGNLSQVNYTLTYPNTNLSLHVDWDTITPMSNAFADLEEDKLALNLFHGLKDAISVWYNVSHSKTCFDIPTSSFVKQDETVNRPMHAHRFSKYIFPSFMNTSTDNLRNDYRPKEIDRTLKHEQMLRHTLVDGEEDVEKKEGECIKSIKKNSVWNSLVCNNNMNLITTFQQGLGNDIFWPPTLPHRNVSNEEKINIRRKIYVENCMDPENKYGYSKSPQTYFDPNSIDMDMTYGGLRIESFTNVVFTNGLFDPWSAAGVILPKTVAMTKQLPGLTIQTIASSLISLQLEYGAHHLDLMFTHLNPPAGVQEARNIQRSNMKQWIQEWQDAQNLRTS